MKSVALHNLGCKVNAYELERIGQKLQEKGYQIIPFDGIADIYIVNTCTVTNIADRKSRQMLHRANHRIPEAIVVALGCYVQTGGEKALEDEGIDLAIGNNRKKDLIPILEAFLEQREKEKAESKTMHQTSVTDIGKETEYEELMEEETSVNWPHTRAYLKIQDGCNQFCSYCIIPFARGRVRSRKPESVLLEAKKLAEAGYQEVVLTGIHLSSYGLDFVSRSDGDYLEGGQDLKKTAMEREYLLNVIREIAAVEGIRRIRLGSLEPRIITRRFTEGLAALPKVCPHFHLSLQSGCDETLKRMNRHYTTEEYYEKVSLLREVYANPAITTDVIVGFPGETEAEFAQTEAFLKRTNFFEMHVFKYSARKGTVAAAMKEQIPESVKSERSAKLLGLEKEQSRNYRASYIGKELSILTEETFEQDGRLFRLGHTDTYVKAAVPAEGTYKNQWITARAEAFLTDEILLLSV